MSDTWSQVLPAVTAVAGQGSAARRCGRLMSISRRRQSGPAVAWTDGPPELISNNLGGRGVKESSCPLLSKQTMPYDPNLQFQLDNSRRQHQRQAEYADYRRRGGSSRGGYVVLLLLIAAGAYIYLAHPEAWHNLVAHVQSFIQQTQQTQQDRPH